MNNRQAGRRRGRGGQRQPGSGGGHSGGRDNGNRIDNRARGNAAQLLEKYKNLAADAQRAGDRVNTEYYLQFADHYFRVLGDSRQRVEETRRSRDEFGQDDEDDFDNDGDGGNEDRGNRDDRGQREDRGAREDRPQREDRNNREDRPQRDERQGRERAQRDDRPARDDRPREDRAPRAERPRRETLRTGAANDRDEVMQVEGEVGTQQSEQAPAAVEAKPTRRRTVRPRAETAPVEGSSDAADASAAIDADRLPPSLSLSANDDGAERPRRRRRVRGDDEVAPPAA